MTIYIDISEFLNTRLTTGIQRVIREFLQRAVEDTYKINILYFDIDLNKYQLLDNNEIKSFLRDIKNYQFKIREDIDLFKNMGKNSCLFDIDSVWNSSLKRDELYKKLKQNNFKIFNFIYDLTPIILPDLARENTKANFPMFIKSVLKYSDYLFFDSISAKGDFFEYKKSLSITRDIYSEVVYLGSDFFIAKNSFNKQHDYLLSKKYILFVGTIEPRKNHLQVVEAFENLHENFSDLHLIFIGQEGWKSEEFMKYLNTHPIKDAYIHHLSFVDDETLTLFYQNAFIVTYLSKYEGYGLPVVESLCYGNITITSNNTSMIEVGHNYAEYIYNNEKSELVDIISLYINNQTLYNQKKEYIKRNYKPPSWDDFYNTLIYTLKKEVLK